MVGAVVPQDRDEIFALAEVKELPALRPHVDGGKCKGGAFGLNCETVKLTLQSFLFDLPQRGFVVACRVHHRSIL